MMSNKEKGPTPMGPPMGLRKTLQSMECEESVLDAKNFLSSLEKGDLSFNEIIEYGLALFGITRAGKTTFSHFLINNPLKAIEIESSVHYVTLN